MESPKIQFWKVVMKLDDGTVQEFNTPSPSVEMTMIQTVMMIENASGQMTVANQRPTRWNIESITIEKTNPPSVIQAARTMPKPSHIGN